MKRCSASYSPRNAELCASSTDVTSASWNDPRSDASWTMRLDIVEAFRAPRPSCANMSPYVAALASAS